MRLERVAYGKMFGLPGGELDLRQLPGGLVALTGPNGHGKTALLETVLAALYRSYASREHDLKTYACARDSFVEAEFSVDGVGAYRARINIDNHTGKTQAVLEQVQPNGSRVPLNDGRVTTFDEAVAQVAPRLDGLLCSAFAAQNRAGSLTTVPKSKRKDLFIHFLWQERVVAMAETAKLCLQVADRARVALDTQRDTLVKETSPEIIDTLRSRVAAIDTELAAVRRRRTELQEILVTLERERALLAEQAQAHLAAQARVTALATAIATKRAEGDQIARDGAAARATAADDLARATQRLQSRLLDLDRRVSTEIAETKTKLLTIDGRIANNKRVLQETDAIRTAAAATAEADAAIRGWREQEQAARAAEVQARDQIEARQQQLRLVEQAETELGTARRRAGLLGTVKFGDDCAVDPACPLVTDAVAARARIPELEGTVAHAPTLKDGITHWQQQLDAAHDRIRALLAQIAEAEQVVADHAAKASLAPHIDLAEQRIAEYERQRTDARAESHARLTDLQAQREGAERETKGAHADIVQRLESRLDQLESRRVTTVAAIADLEQAHAEAMTDAERTRTASARVDLIDVDLAARRQQWTETEATLATLIVRQQDVTRAGDAVALRLQERQDVERRLALVGHDWRVQQLLAKALHRDGLPTLEIAAAGPAVSQACTDLLEHSGFGTRFTVDVVTQVATADGKGLKEDFNVLVYDNERGGEPRDIGDLSGGERIVVEEALRAALAIYVNARHERPIRTCWRDETTSALDIDNRRRYVAMLRRLRELGGFEHVLYVSHADDAVDAADTQVDVWQGATTVRRAA